MNNTTNSFIQRATQLGTNTVAEVNAKEGKCNFTEPKINYFPEESFSAPRPEDDLDKTPEMTQAQWKKYYKKMGLE